MKRLLFAAIYIFLAISYAQCRDYKVAVFDFDDRLNQPATTAKYIEIQLKKKFPDIQADQYSGKNNVECSIKVLKNLDEKGLDMIITITTDALIIASHILKQTPVLFTNVNNPLHLGFKTLGPPGGNISGVSYYISVEKQLAFYKKIMPHLSHIGFIFDRNNKSKKIELPESRNACRKIGIRHRIEVVSSEQELEKAAFRLIAWGAKAIAIGSSDLLYNHISLILSGCNKAGVPIFSFNKEGVNQGAVAALSSDYKLMVDKLLIPMAILVLKKGKSPGELPIGFLKENQIFINKSQTEKLNLRIPKDILDNAVFIHKIEFDRSM